MKAEYTIGAIVSGAIVSGLLFLFLVSPSPAPITASVPQISLDSLAPTTASGDAGVTGVPYTEIVHPSGFVNTKEVTLKELIGKKVILIDFLTYSCINCQRTFPYMVAWYKKYKDQGLEIIGIHTPEFAFEKNIDNVRDAMHKFGITYPIVLDNDYATWNAYGNQYWPRKYLIDIHGNVVYDHIGEGGYEETEMKIQELLAERMQVLGMQASDTDGSLVASTIPEGVNTAKSPETYFGSSRNTYLANGTPGSSGEQTSSLPTVPANNALYLGGTWRVVSEYAESVADASVLYRYNAKEVYIVAEADVPVTVEVWQDGVLVGGAKGEDVTGTSTVVMQTSRLYKLIRNAEPGEHTLQLKVKGEGLRLFAFTFG